MKEINLAVFDMAGTTVETGDQVSAAFESALHNHGINASRWEIDEQMGASKLEVIRSFIQRDLEKNSSDLEEKIYKEFNEFLCERYSNGDINPIQGVTKTLSILKENGMKVAFTTGFGNEIANVILDNLEWRNSLVDAVICSDDVSVGRPAPYMVFRAMEKTGATDVSQVLVAGDTVYDLEAGANAGAGIVIGVLSGTHGVEQLGKVRHSYILTSVSTLPELLDWN